jgi:hypothetical protein
MLNQLRKKGFEVLALHHAEAILTRDMRGALNELETILAAFEIPAVELIRGGGGEGQGTQRLRKALAAAGWLKHTFQVRKTVDGEVRESASHEVDHVKRFGDYTIALEIEWNNKDPFFDRDLENFKRLHSDGAISVGAIITRGRSLHEGLRDVITAFAQTAGIQSLEDLAAYYKPTDRQRGLVERHAKSRESFAAGWANAFVADKFGEATTHWRKLADRVERGVGNPCPLLLIGIPRSVVLM